MNYQMIALEFSMNDSKRTTKATLNSANCVVTKNCLRM